MKVDWKPGDVAVLALGKGGSVPVRALRTSTGYWVDTDGVTVEDGEPWGVRPLAALDSEDREQVERLASLLATHGAHRGRVSKNAERWAIRDALREFADPKPPKPDEPLGLGAVVEDEAGDLWIRTCHACDDCLNKPWQRGPVRRNWLIVAAVKVLSQGVTP